MQASCGRYEAKSFFSTNSRKSLFNQWRLEAAFARQQADEVPITLVSTNRTLTPDVFNHSNPIATAMPSR